MKAKFDISLEKTPHRGFENSSIYDFKRVQAVATHVLFSKGRVQSKFFTKESGLYPEKDQELSGSNKKKKIGKIKTWDSVSHRVVENYRAIRPSSKSILFGKYQKAINRCNRFNEQVKDEARGFFERISLVHIWNTSIVFSLVAGMFFMSLIYRYMGQSASALESIGENRVAYEEFLERQKERKEKMGDEWNQEKEDEYMAGVMNFIEQKDQESFEREVRKMVKGYPIEKMLPYIFQKDRTVAAFIIGIAKKESNWGKRRPVLNGQDCYNYWGYRGIREKMGSGGHTCFDGPEDAINTVSKRLEWFVEKKKIDTPEEMIVWKCGSSCEGHSDYSVRKWISDVDMYFSQLNKK